MIAYDASRNLSPMSSGITQVPNVIDLTLAAATTIITQRSFFVGGATQQTGGHTADAIVTAQTPATPAMAPVGSAIELQVDARTGGAKLVTVILGARMTAYLCDLRNKRYARWTRDVGAGLHTLLFRLPASVQLRKGNRYRMELYVRTGSQAVVRRTRIDF